MIDLGIVKIKQIDAGARYVTLVQFESGLVAAVTEDGTVTGGSYIYSKELIQHAFTYQVAMEIGVQTW